MAKRLILAVVCTALTAFSVAQAATLVPPGNRNEEQPDVPGASTRRTKAGNTTFDGKYLKVINLFKRDAALRDKIRKAARAYKIDPVHIAGAIIGEHTYNVDAYDRLQTYYVKAIAYLSNTLEFAHKGEKVDAFIKRTEFSVCEEKTNSYDLWFCREQVWNDKFRGKTVGGRSYPNNRFSAVFFQPFYAGQTFGLGQLNPMTALQLSDDVNRVSGLPKLSASDPNNVYETIMDPDKSIPYVAAVLRRSIDAYASIADMDISKNPGVTSTLYNLGNPEGRAAVLRNENARRKAAGEALKLPEENYYGWLVNEKLAEIEAIFD